MKTTVSIANSRARANRIEEQMVDRATIVQIIEPLVSFALTAGISIRDLNSMVREAAVRNGLQRHHRAALHPNISGIAASTGISRSEISKILKDSLRRSRSVASRAKTVTQRLSIAWHKDAKFRNSGGLPADLCVHGRAASFDALARKYGGGLPTRALLDEMMLDGSIALLDSGLVRLTVAPGDASPLGSQDVQRYRETITDLMSGILKTVRCTNAPEFIIRLTTPDVSSSASALLPLDIGKKCADFVTNWCALKGKPAHKNSSRINASEAKRISVTIFCVEVSSGSKKTIIRSSKRKNFRRR